MGLYAEVDGKIIAFWNVIPDYKTKTVEGDILAVNPDFKGQHIGLKISLQLIENLRDMGMLIFRTDTSLKNPTRGFIPQKLWI